ncbi:MULTISPECIES: hypothetical protein [Moraxella]|uniref:Uncharacterized protein n=1 Tax=Moraxella catarrhalis TaxID=480 RepID=A0A7Z1A3Q5_MORCA|nr:hypothetical protein [Moraxella catarrhalis]OAV00243.1 hypothetical protein AO382_1393 [Moraxella catarrhalis]STY82511.1 Uncharacterised protein [Moraxella catarrhalis]
MTFSRPRQTQAQIDEVSAWMAAHPDCVTIYQSHAPKPRPAHTVKPPSAMGYDTAPSYRRKYDGRARGSYTLSTAERIWYDALKQGAVIAECDAKNVYGIRRPASLMADINFLHPEQPITTTIAISKSGRKVRAYTIQRAS